MNIVEDDRYKDLCAEFQHQWIAALRDTLKKHGIPANLAKDICGDFSFDLSMLFDQGEIDAGGDTYRPVVAFTDDADEPALIFEYGAVEFHEYAFGTTADVFKST
jgi:hypothetical protein